MRSHLALIACLSLLVAPDALAQTEAPPPELAQAENELRAEPAPLAISPSSVDAGDASKILMDTMDMKEIGTEMVEPEAVKAAAAPSLGSPEAGEPGASGEEGARFVGLALVLGGVALGGLTFVLLRRRPRS